MNKASPAELLKTAYQMRLLTQTQVNECAHRFKQDKGATPMEQILADGFLAADDLDRVQKRLALGSRKMGLNPAALLKTAFQMRLLTQKQVNECMHKLRQSKGARTMEQILLDGYLEKEQLQRARRKLVAASAAPGRREPSTPPPPPKKRRLPVIPIAIVAAVAGMIVVGLWQAGVFSGSDPVVANGNGTPTPNPPDGNGTPDPGPGPVVPPPQEVVTIQRENVPGDDRIAQDWNRLMRRTTPTPALEDMPGTLRQATNILAAAREDNHPGLATIERVTAAIQSRARYLLNAEYESVYQRAQEHVENRRFGDAIHELEWFPVDFDPTGEFGEILDAETERILAAARDAYRQIVEEVDRLVASGDTEAAKEALQRALAFGVEEIADDAHQRLADVNAQELAHIRSEAAGALDTEIARRRPEAEGMSASALLDRAEEASRAAIRDRAPERFVEAMADLVIYAGVHPVNAQFNRILDRIFKQAAFDERALALYGEILDRTPENPDALSGYVRLLVSRGEFDRAVQAVEDAPVGALSAGVGSFRQQIATIQRSQQRREVQEFSYQRGNYRVYTDMSVDRAIELAELMNRLYGMYSTVFQYPKNEAFVFPVLVFGEQRDFNTYRFEIFGETDVGRAGQTQAFYWPTTNELVLYEGPGMESIAQHEAFHQFVDFYVNDCPTWFNEGFASYFETSTATESRMNDGRIREYLFGAPPNVRQRTAREVMMMSRSAWDAGGNAVWWYGASWSLIYYQMTHEGEQRLKDYFQELIYGRSQQEAFDTVFGTRIDEIETGWRAWLEEERARIMQPQR